MAQQRKESAAACFKHYKYKSPGHAGRGLVKNGLITR